MGFLVTNIEEPILHPEMGHEETVRCSCCAFCHSRDKSRCKPWEGCAAKERPAQLRTTRSFQSAEKPRASTTLRLSAAAARRVCSSCVSPNSGLCSAAIIAHANVAAAAPPIIWASRSSCSCSPGYALDPSAQIPRVRMDSAHTRRETRQNDGLQPETMGAVAATLAWAALLVGTHGGDCAA